jgi:VanZ family protein
MGDVSHFIRMDTTYMSMKSMIKVCSIAVVSLLLLFAALGPAKWQQRTGLGWQLDHLVTYFALTAIFCFAWPRPRVVGGTLMVASVVLEAAQAFTPDRTASLVAALYGSAGALAAALVADLFVRARTWLSGRAVLMPRRARPALDPG